ncbi:MAG TPA: efflux RND transporter permease subunit, partial [Alphaproteobacteria bacterium]|nr:efflux RND transporter permease subunit [Alphaproteobacteria bacterium]
DTGDGRFAIKVPGLIKELDDLLNMPVKVNGDAVVRFRDIAEVRRSFKDRESFARVNGHPAVALEITKRTGENIIDTIARVRSIVEEESRQWPDAINVTYSQDRSEDIRIMLSDLQNNVVSAILLIMILIVGALGLRSGLLVGIAIPGSFLTGILLLFTLGFTVNIVVLFALILAVGMLVDGAIVVTEYADRKMAEGLDRRQAYGLAAKRMAWPITSSTATTLAAFLPLLFWPGVVGEFMKFLPLTLIATLAASLSMALIFVPTLGAWFGKPGDIDPARMRALAAGETGDVRETGGLTGAYVKLLDGAIRRAGLVMTAAVVALFGIWAYYVVNGNGVEFFPAVEPEQAIILVHARGNLSVGEEDALVREVENEVLALSGEFASVYTRTGAAGQGQDVGEDVIGQIQIELTDWDQRRPASEILADIRERTAGLAGIRVEAREPEAGPPVGKAIQVQLTSRLPELLPEAADKIRAKLESMPGLIDIEDSLSSPGVEWELQIDRAHAARFGLDVTAVGQAVKLVTNGLVIGAYRPDDTDDEIDLVVRYPEQYRSIEQLDNIRLMTDAGGVPISNFIERTAQPKVGTIDRVEARRAVTVSADVLPDVLPAEKVEQIRAWLADAGLDGRVDVQFRGEDEEQQAAMQFLGKAFAVALFLIAIILLTQFNSFYSAALILSAVVMSTVGVLIGLIVTGQPFGIVMTGIGVIALAGIVVNNNIVLIDTFDRLVASGHDVREAILRTGAQRLRPVMLTTITTILGLMPMTLSTNIDFVNRAVSVGAPSTQWWVGLSTAIVFGLTFATVLTLIVTPSALMLRAEVHAWRMRRRERPQSRPAGDEERYARAAE